MPNEVFIKYFHQYLNDKRSLKPKARYYLYSNYLMTELHQKAIGKNTLFPPETHIMITQPIFTIFSFEDLLFSLNPLFNQLFYFCSRLTTLHRHSIKTKLARLQHPHHKKRLVLLP